MKLIVIPALLLGLLIGQSLGNADPSLCYGKSNGDQIPNNQDCASYYVCNYGVPKLFKCNGGTFYDIKLKVCNWPENVTCGQVIAQPEQPQVLPPIEVDPMPPIEVDPIPPIVVDPMPPIQETPEIEVPSQPDIEIPPPVFDGIEYYPGIIELDNIPGFYQCINNGFYFAPHPYLCEQYFICENYKIHTHQCGNGIHWDYVFAQCDFPHKSQCYSHPIEEDVTTQSTEAPTVELSTIGAITPIEVHPPTSKPENTIDTIVPNCPGEQSFYANPKDCHKYYICIGGIPISTTCPDNMVWDAEAFQCTENLDKCVLTNETIELLL